MKMRPRPYNAIRYYYWGEEFVLGDASDAHNLMGSYDEIRLNLPGRGMSEFDPLLPRVMKWRSELGVVAGDVVTFVDDVRVTGYDCSKENCRNVHHQQFASRIQYLGMQDDAPPRKFRRLHHRRKQEHGQKQFSGSATQRIFLNMYRK